MTLTEKVLAKYELQIYSYYIFTALITHVPLKSKYISNRVYGVTSYETVVLIAIVLQTSSIVSVRQQADSVETFLYLLLNKYKALYLVKCNQMSALQVYMFHFF
jgi:hypothetical protein